MYIVSLPHEGLYSFLQCLGKFYSYDTHYQTSTQDLNAQQQSMKYVYGDVRATTARGTSNNSKLQNADDAEATVSVHVRNDFRPYLQTAFEDLEGRPVTTLTQSTVLRSRRR